MKRPNWMKTLMSACLCVAVISSPLTAFAATPGMIYEEKSPEIVYAKGVTKQNIKRFTKAGWINAEVIRVDLTNQAKMDVIVNEYLSSRDTLSKLVEKNNTEKDIVAAINADFFDTKANTTMGHVVKSGKVLTTAINMSNFATFNISGTGTPYVAYTNSTLNTFKSATEEVKIDFFNKPYYKFNFIVCLDRSWSKKTKGKALGQPILEILVQDHKIVDMRKSGEPFDIPENGYVIAGVGQSVQTLENKFQIGDEVSINLDPNLSLTQLAISGGTQLIKDGKTVSKFTQNGNTNAPRTAIGISQDRNELILVTVDGYNKPYKGMSFTEMAQFLMELGAYEGMAFDGGGSTQSMGKSPWDESLSVLNYPSDGAERRMYTGLVVRKNRMEKPVLEAIKVDSKQNKYYVNTEMPLSISAHDSNYDLMDVNVDDVIWSVSGVKGKFIGQTFYPASTGKGTIQAVYQGKRAEFSFEVVKGATKLIVSPSHIALAQSQEQALSFSVLTESGESFPIPASAVKYTPDQPVGAYDAKTGLYRSGETTGQGYVSFEIEGLRSYVPVSVGMTAMKLYDFEKPTAKGRPVPSNAPGHYFESPLISKSGSGGQLVFDFTTTDETRAMYMDFNAVTILPSNATGIGMWVYGDEGNGHWLRGHILDSAGNTHFLTFAKEVNWKGWKYVTADLPAEAKGSLTFNRIYMVESDAQKKSSGYIVVDDIDVQLAQEVLVELPEDKHRIKAMADYKLPNGFSSKTKGVVNVAYASEWTKAMLEKRGTLKSSFLDTEKGFKAEFINGTWVITVNNKGLSIVKNGTEQWQKIFEFLKKAPKAPVIVVMNDGFAFSDPLEKALFYEKFEALAGELIVVHPTTLKEPSMRFYKGVQVLHIPYSGKDEIPYVSLVAQKGKIYFSINQLK